MYQVISINFKTQTRKTPHSANSQQKWKLRRTGTKVLLSTLLQIFKNVPAVYVLWPACQKLPRMTNVMSYKIVVRHQSNRLRNNLQIPPTCIVSVVLRFHRSTRLCQDARIQNMFLFATTAEAKNYGTTTLTQLQTLYWTTTSNLFLTWCCNEVEHKGDNLELKENVVAGQKLKVRPWREASAMDFNLQVWIKVASDAIISSSFRHHFYITPIIS